MRYVTYALLLLPLLCVAASCTTSQSRFSRLTEPYPAKPETFEVAVFETGLPERPFERIARLDVHLEKTHFLPSSLKEALRKLQEQARLAGADAIVEIQERRSMVNETTVYHVTATGIRYTDTP